MASAAGDIHACKNLRPERTPGLELSGPSDINLGQRCVEHCVLRWPCLGYKTFRISTVEQVEPEKDIIVGGSGTGGASCKNLVNHVVHIRATREHRRHASRTMCAWSSQCRHAKNDAYKAGLTGYDNFHRGPEPVDIRLWGFLSTSDLGGGPLKLLAQ